MNDTINIYQIAKQHEQTLRQQAAQERSARAAAEQGARQRAGQALIALGQRLRGSSKQRELQTAQDCTA